ncbi:MAG: hypothetical protein H6525_10575 [Actinobacteria bacterium]|nr:hypothetical protein [Actinomycetota bacterium]MCB9413268.1 hypothetical protein [Actinomycetota bacterium]
MDENSPQPGHLSDDGQWVWTGDQWAPTGGDAAPAANEFVDQTTEQGYAPEPGYEQTGYDPNYGTGYEQTGYDQAGYDQAGYGQTTYEQSGYDQTGYDAGYDPNYYAGYGQVATSPESGWRWDGQQWVPVAAGTMPPPATGTPAKKPNLLLIAALAAVILILGLIAVWLLTRGSGSSGSDNPQPTATVSVQPSPTSPTDAVTPTFDPSLNPTDAPSVFGSPTASDPLNTSPSPTGPLTVDQAAAAVDWNRFAPGTQARVDTAAASGNCAELANLRQTAITNDASVAASTGQGTADLVAYIEAQERAVGCTVAPAP